MLAENSGISWTDHTFNPWMGCTKVSPACKHCYAERDMDHRYGKVAWGPNGTRVLTSDANWKLPLKWNREAAAWQLHLAFCERSGITDPVAEWARRDGGNLPAIPRRPRVFCASLADVFEDWQGQVLSGGVPVTIADDGSFIRNPDCPFGHRPATLDDIRQRLFKLIDATPYLDWLLLTKRPENIRKMWCSHVNTDGKPPLMLHRSNVWLGTSIENQEYADKRLPELLKCRHLSPVLFLSCEPLLGPVDLKLIGCPECGKSEQNWFPNYTICKSCGSEVKSPPEPINWVIAGGESGPGARPSHPDWFRSIRDHADACEVAFHFKQWGEWVPGDHDCVTFADNEVLPWHDKQGSDITPMCRVGVKRAGRLLDGALHDAFPA